MKHNSKFIAPALVVLSMFAFTPAHAEPDKNGGGETDQNGGDNGGGGGSGGGGDNGGGEVDKNGGGNHGNGGGKHGGGVTYSGGGGSGSSYDTNSGVITCVINGRVFKVRDVRRCYVQPTYGDYEIRPPVYKSHKKKYRRTMVSGDMTYGGGFAQGGGYSYGGGYGYEQQAIIRYYKPASRAAVMQQQKRARRAATQAYAYGGGFGYEGGYGYGGGYAVQGGYGYEGGNAVTRKKLRRVRTQAPIYMPSYDQGYVVHYGPAMSKGGGY